MVNFRPCHLLYKYGPYAHGQLEVSPERGGRSTQASQSGLPPGCLHGASPTNEVGCFKDLIWCNFVSFSFTACYGPHLCIDFSSISTRFWLYNINEVFSLGNQKHSYCESLEQSRSPKHISINSGGLSHDCVQHACSSSSRLCLTLLQAIEGRSAWYFIHLQFAWLKLHLACVRCLVLVD